MVGEVGGSEGGDGLRESREWENIIKAFHYAKFKATSLLQCYDIYLLNSYNYLLIRSRFKSKKEITITIAYMP